MEIVKGPWYSIRRDAQGVPYVTADLGPVYLFSSDVKECIPRLATSVPDLARWHLGNNPPTSLGGIVSRDELARTAGGAQALMSWHAKDYSVAEAAFVEFETCVELENRVG